jgi:DNA-binding transcriptional LysR family regulator
MMIDLNSLAIFATVVDANSFSEAARRLKMPVSTVSRRIAELEDQLGVRLLERSTRNLRLTDVGSEVLDQARLSVEVSEAIDNVVSNRLSNISGLLRLSAPPSISDTMLLPLIGAFHASYPDVRVEIFVTDRYVDPIAEGIDISTSAAGEPGLSRKGEAARETAGPARPPPSRLYVLQDREQLDVSSCKRRGQ